MWHSLVPLRGIIPWLSWPTSDSPGGLFVIVKLDGLKPVSAIDQRGPPGRTVSPGVSDTEASECQNVPGGADISPRVTYTCTNRCVRLTELLWFGCERSNVPLSVATCIRLKAWWRFTWHRCHWYCSVLDTLRKHDPNGLLAIYC